MDKQNICKFITTQNLDLLRATAFFFETKVILSGQEQQLPFHRIYLISSGEGSVRIAGQWHQVTAGNLFFTFADLPFTIENTGKLQYYCIHFSGGRADELFRRFGITPHRCLFDSCEGLVPLWQNSLTRANTENIDLLSEGLLLYTFSRLKKEESRSNDLVSFVLTYLDEHFTEHRLSLQEVAEAAGYHEKYLSHVFKKQFGIGFTEYLRTMRIKHAITLIENGVTSVKNVALLCGFSDPLYFSRVFTEAVGVSPKHYRNRCT